MRSAAWYWLGRSTSQESGRGLPKPSPMFAPSDTRLIASTPHAMPTSMAPVAISPATRWVACCADPHWQSTVVAPVASVSPACSQAVRVMCWTARRPA